MTTRSASVPNFSSSSFVDFRQSQIEEERSADYFGYIETTEKIQHLVRRTPTYGGSRATVFYLNEGLVAKIITRPLLGEECILEQEQEALQELKSFFLCNLVAVGKFHLFSPSNSPLYFEKDSDHHLREGSTALIVERGPPALGVAMDKYLLSPHELFLIAAQLIDFLLFLQEKRWAHLDLSVDNVLYDQETHLIKICDLGLSRSSVEDLNLHCCQSLGWQHPLVIFSRFPTEASLLLTKQKNPNYIEENQEDIQKILFKGADVFSIAALLYQLLGGNHLSSPIARQEDLSQEEIDTIVKRSYEVWSGKESYHEEVDQVFINYWKEYLRKYTPSESDLEKDMQIIDALHQLILLSTKKVGTIETYREKMQKLICFFTIQEEGAL